MSIAYWFMTLACQVSITIKRNQLKGYITTKLELKKDHIDDWDVRQREVIIITFI